MIELVEVDKKVDLILETADYEFWQSAVDGRCGLVGRPGSPTAYRIWL